MILKLLTMKKFGNIASPFDFRKDYQILGNAGQLIYLWGALDLVFMAFNLDEIGREIRRYGADFYASAMIWDVIKIGGGITMKYYKRKNIREIEEIKASKLEKKVED